LRGYREKAEPKEVDMAGMGPAPKPPSKRRRRTKPASYGAATPITAPAAGAQDRQLGFDPHPLITDLWRAVQESCESRFYSEADWARLRLELWYASTVMAAGRLSGSAWEAVQHGLNEMLLSPAIKRRCAIEVTPAGPDTDENTAVAMMASYRSKLKPVD
jgi:hypothetical protein